MIYDVPEEFKRKLDDFNADQGGPTAIAVAWNQKKERWQIWAIPIDGSHHPLYNPGRLHDMCRPVPDGSGRMGVLLMSWCKRDSHGSDIGFMPLDDRLLHALKWADSFADRRHFENTIEQQEFKKEAELRNDVREVAYAAKSYWHSMDRLAVAPHTKGGGDWRWRYR